MNLTIILRYLFTVFEFQSSIAIAKTPTPPLSGGLYYIFCKILHFQLIFGTLDATELPSTNLTLQYVAIGRGTQNYTCASSSSLPVPQGAVATLFDLNWLAYHNEPLLNTIPPVAVYLPLQPYGFGLTFPVAVLGQHFFDSTGTPTFDLYSVNKALYGSKTGDIKAPAAANKGPAGTGAVDWLQLTANAGYESNGLSLAYRVVTAGGQPFNCTVAGAITVQYAAEYWFYD